MTRQNEPGATPSPAAPATGRTVSGQPVDQGLVLLLQRELQVADYDPGPLDGTSGPKFAAAVAAYQRANRLRVDGHASSELLSRLARDNLNAGRRALPAKEAAPASGLAALPSAEIGQDAAPGRTAGLESGATLKIPTPVRAPAPTGRELVRAIQERLSNRGYCYGPLDGIPPLITVADVASDRRPCRSSNSSARRVKAVPPALARLSMTMLGALSEVNRVRRLDRDRGN